MTQSISKIPSCLYRGDSDRRKIRQVEDLIEKGTLQTNLASGGKGTAIFTKPLLELVKLHIQPGWDKSHFLSFSESDTIAHGFGAYGYSGEPYPCNEDESCDYVLFKFASHNLIDVFKKEVGLFECTYESVYRNNRGGPGRILLINTVEYLQNQVGKECDQQLDNAHRDKEWLILPINGVLLSAYPKNQFT